MIRLPCIGSEKSVYKTFNNFLDIDRSGLYSNTFHCHYGPWHASFHTVYICITSPGLV